MSRQLTSVILLAAAFALLVSVPVGNGQSVTASTRSTFAMTIGPATVKPKIDGVWESKEWDDANQVRLGSYVRVNGLGEAYLRMKYDTSNLYLLFDVPSDKGTVRPAGQQQYVLASFDTNNDGWTTDDSLNDFIITFSVNGTRLVLGWYPGQPQSSIVDNITAAYQMGVSPQSSARHRIYEVSIPLPPLLKAAPISSLTNLPTIGFDACALDGYGNVLCIVIPGITLAELSFGTIPIPESIELAVPVLLAVVSLSLLRYNRTRKRPD